jgi:hypothetical protein
MGPIIAAGIKAAPYALSALSALGGIFGKKKRKYMDEQTLRQLYGPQAVTRDATDLAHYILNSPYGQELMTSAAEQGQSLQTAMAGRAAEAGLSPDTGGQSGASDFAVSAATGAQSGLERQTKSGIYQAALPLAAQMAESRMQAALGQQSEQNAVTPVNLMGRIGSAAGQVAATIPAAAPPATVQPPVVTTPTVAAPVVGPSLMQGTLTSSRSAGMRRGLRGYIPPRSNY